MNIAFTSPLEQEPGIIADLLKSSYAELVSAAPQYWRQEVANWEEFDKDVLRYPNSVGACVFLTWADDLVIGLGSYDNRPMPDYGIIGHNCILPAFRGKGLGRLQILEILRRFEKMEILMAKVSTNEHPFFIPAQKMYIACGFREVRRVTWDRNPELHLIEYEKKL